MKFDFGVKDIIYNAQLQEVVHTHIEVWLFLFVFFLLIITHIFLFLSVA